MQQLGTLSRTMSFRDAPMHSQQHLTRSLKQQEDDQHSKQSPVQIELLKEPLIRPLRKICKQLEHGRDITERSSRPIHSTLRVYQRRPVNVIQSR